MMDENVSAVKNKVSPKTIIALVCALVAVLLVTVFLVYIFQPTSLQKKYDNAIRLIEIEEYAKAYEEFKELGDYRDSKDYLARFSVVYERIEEIVKNGSNTVIEYTFNDKGQVLSRIKKDVKEGFIRDSFKFTYDKDGNMLSEEWISGFDKTSNKYEYQYDKNGNKISQKQIHDGKTEREIFYEYDDRGNCIKIKSGSIIECKSYDYDKNGNEILSTVLDADGNVKTRTETTYNSMGQVLSKYHKNADGDITESIENTYDKNGNLVKKIRKVSTFIIHEENSYDKDNNMLSHKMWSNDLSKDGKMTTSEEKVFTYDKSGNRLTESSESYIDGFGGVSEYSRKYVYDGQGNVIRIEYENGYTDYKYSGERRVIYKSMKFNWTD
ncbi:MAG: hypothetical protein IKU45_01120 [Clostridia bacterium]|nr:hypothetical protein [Clostridia bacterium]